ncbi:bifunctional glutamate N-acetyltransferase/amino-acid acetyltransferase ArgJ, partial [Alphaproteobacteria bacterium]|nr:bifunctional glutamate N-acetyltransferase/amino-acid acetyltransferase ArgJ [Alphaproteobacteria bacterium]
LITFNELASVAGVFTRSKTAAAPVNWCKSIINNGSAKALIVNSGNANAFTGYQGNSHVTAITACVAKEIGCKANEVFVASTGVIGEYLPIAKILNVIPALSKSSKNKPWSDAANAMRTTDTYIKLSSEKYILDGKKFVINAIAKGSGMIAPDMATMLVFLFTDANISSEILSFILKKENHKTFNAITVDSDTSTSDTVLFFSTNQGENKEIDDYRDSRLKPFKSAVKKIMTDLSKQIVKDAEGISKFITIKVTEASSVNSAKKIANSIANSPLVKTAIAGEDPNWGRIVMAIGKSGQRVDRDKIKITIGSELITENGAVKESYNEELTKLYMQNREININVALGIGKSSFTVWTSDFTESYVRINSDYRS